MFSPISSLSLHQQFEQTFSHYLLCLSRSATHTKTHNDLINLLNQIYWSSLRGSMSDQSTARHNGRSGEAMSRNGSDSRARGRLLRPLRLPEPLCPCLEAGDLSFTWLLYGYLQCMLFMCCVQQVTVWNELDDSESNSLRYPLLASRSALC